MARIIHLIACVALAVTVLGGPAQAQQQPTAPAAQPARPPFATTKSR